MKNDELAKFSRMLFEGDLHELDARLRPFLESGDLDARYLATRYSIDPNLTGEAFDRRAASELHELASLWHVPSLVTLAWMYLHGDDVEPDRSKFKDLMGAAALLGSDEARRAYANYLEIDLDCGGLVEMMATDRDERR